MDIKDRIDIISSIGEEIIGKDNLEPLLTNKKNIIAYDGFEPSGRMHIAQGLLRSHNVNKFIKSGVKFKFWVADWFALMNLKLGGDLNKIQKAGQLMIETWKACGMNIDSLDNDGNQMIEFIWSSKEINTRSEEYWRLVLDIATKFGLNRIKKCTQIMGRKEEASIIDKLNELNENLDKTKQYINDCLESKIYDLNILNEKMNETKLLINSIINKEELTTELMTSQIFYPVMQCADIFFLGVDILSLGMDQKKVNMLAIEYCDKIKRKNKPIVISHHMLMGLDGSDKMSKSNPDNTIFMDDNNIEVKRKITKAFCEPNNIVKNPLLDWAKYLVFPLNNYIIIPENKKWNEPEMIFYNYNDLEQHFADGKVQPKGLKESMINHINQLLLPVREYFINNKNANELLKTVKSFGK
ncbi:tyrosyl-tRNA synthetase [Chlorella virus XW01]|nr:tyrosyl-tRNA synthetase [Chlorella virus XW01]